MGLLYQPLRRDSLQIEAQRQRVDEHAQYSLDTRAAVKSAKEHSSVDHIVTAGSACYDQTPYGMEERCYADPQAPRPVPEALRDCSVDHPLRSSALGSVTLGVKHAERRCWFFDVSEFPAKKALCVVTARVRERLGHMISIGP